VTRVMRIWSGS